MIVHFTYDKDQWIRCHRRYLFLSMTLTKVELGALAALVLFCVTYVFTSHGSWQSWSLVLLCVFAVSIMGYMYFGQPNRIFSTPGFDRPHTLDFNEDGVDYETDGVISSTPWENFLTWLETEEAFYLSEIRQGYTLIPKKALSGTEVKELRDILAEHLPKNSFPRKR